MNDRAKPPIITGEVTELMWALRVAGQQAAVLGFKAKQKYSDGELRDELESIAIDIKKLFNDSIDSGLLLARTLS